MTEHQLQKYVVGLLRYLARKDAIWLAIPNGEARSPITGAKLKAAGVRPGAADLLVVIKGKAYFLELKTAKGRQSPAQKAFETLALAAGAEYSIARSPEGAKAILERWGALQPNSIGDILRGIGAAA